MQISSRHREGSRETARPFRPWSDLRSRKSAWAVRRKRLPGGGLRAEGVGAAQDGGPLPGRAHPEARDGDQGAVSDICCCRGSGSEARGPRAGGGSSRDAAPRAWFLPARGPAAQASGRAGRGGRDPACEEWVGVGDAALPSAPDPGDAALPLGWGRGPRAAGFAPTFEFRPLGGAGKPGGPASDLGWRGGACEVVQRQRGAGVDASGGLGGAGAGREAPRVGPGCRARTCCRPLAAAGSPGRCSPSSGRAPSGAFLPLRAPDRPPACWDPLLRGLASGGTAADSWGAQALLAPRAPPRSPPGLNAWLASLAVGAIVRVWQWCLC